MERTWYLRILLFFKCWIWKKKQTKTPNVIAPLNVCIWVCCTNLYIFESSFDKPLVFWWPLTAWLSNDDCIFFLVCYSIKAFQFTHMRMLLDITWLQHQHSVLYPTCFHCYESDSVGFCINSDAWLSFSPSMSPSMLPVCSPPPPCISLSDRPGKLSKIIRNCRKGIHLLVFGLFERHCEVPV